MKKRILTMGKTISILVIIVLVTVYGITAFKNKPAESSEDKTFAYSFMLKDLEGKSFSFEQYKGKVVFINLWATWCGPCRTEMPGIQKLYEAVGSEDIVFVMLSVDRDGEQRKVASYISGNKYSFPVFMPSGGLPEQLRVPSIPTTFIVGKDGKVALHHVGSTNYNTDKYKKLLQDLAKVK